MEKNDSNEKQQKKNKMSRVAVKDLQVRKADRVQGGFGVGGGLSPAPGPEDFSG